MKREQSQQCFATKKTSKMKILKMKTFSPTPTITTRIQDKGNQVGRRMENAKLEEHVKVMKVKVGWRGKNPPKIKKN